MLFVWIKNNNQPMSKYNDEERIIEGKILSYSFLDNQLQMVIQGKEKILVYYYLKEDQITSLKEKIKYHNRVYLKGKITDIQENGLPNVFSYQKYLQAHQINTVFSATSIEIKETTNWLDKIKQNIKHHIEKIDDAYIEAFLLGNKDKLNMDLYTINGINHLFAVSGIHILFLIRFLQKRIKEKNKQIIIIIILSFYVYLLNFQVSILRAFSFYMMNIINHKMKYLFTKIELFIILFCTFLLVNPYIIWDLAFQYSFVVTFFLIISARKEKTWIKISIIAFLASLPITAMNYYEVNFLSLGINLLLSPFITSFLYPFAWIVFFFPFLEPLFHFCTLILENINQVFSTISFARVVFPKCFIGIWILYYLLLLIEIKGKNKQKSKIGIIFLLIILYLSPKFSNKAFASFLDVGQGDCAFFISPHQKEVIMIDTGGKQNQSNQAKQIATYLKSLGIKKIDTLILTHGDQDHAKNALDLKDKITIKEVLLNHNEKNTLEQRISKMYKITNKLKTNFFQIKILSSENVSLENEASLVLRIEFWNYKILMMGDAPKEIERKIINQVSKVDILKIGHHGSKTSSSPIFLKKANPEYAIISVGKNNTYHLPSKITLDELKKLQIKTLLTSEEKTIEFSFQKTNYQVKTFFDTIRVQKW